MTVRVGINGFGRIGRQSLKALIERTPEVEVVAVNDLVDVKTNALLFKHDSTYGAYPGEVTTPTTPSSSTARRSRFSRSRIPATLPWGDLGVDVVIESTGVFTDAREGRAHITGRGEEGHPQRLPAKKEGRHDRARRERRQARPADHQIVSQRVVHDQLPGARSPRCSTTSSASSSAA